MKTGEHIPADLPVVKRGTLLLVAGSAVALLVVLFVVGFWIRHERVKKREKMAEETRQQPLVVQVVQPKAGSKSFELTLPADVRPYAATSLYARTNGYLASWNVDINDRVKQGDVMAVIAAPDTDAELEEAEASLNQQRTNLQLASATDERYRGLIATRGVTRQQLDQTNSAKEQAQANVVSSTAAVDRLKALVGFEKIVAPFDGIVTARTYDVGALISAANIGPGQALFSVAQDDRLRVSVNIPQAYALLIKYDQPAALVLARNYPGRKFAGVVKRSAGVLDPVTRTLRTEVEVENDDPSHHIFPGMYGQVVFTLDREQPVLTIPSSALLFEADGKQVAVVGADNKIHFQQIVPGNDFGVEIEILSGLRGGERIVTNPGEQLAEGLVVAPKSADQGGAPHGAAAR